MHGVEAGKPNGPWWDKGIFGALSVLVCAYVTFFAGLGAVALVFEAGKQDSVLLQSVALMAPWIILPWLPAIVFRMVGSKRALPVAIIFAILVLMVLIPCGLIMLL